VNRRRRLLATALLGAVALYALSRLPTWSAAALARGLSAFFGRSASVSAVRFHFLPVEIEISGVRVAGRTAEEPPFLEIPRAVATPSLAPLWGRRIDLSRLLIQGAKIRINAFAEGGDDLPRFGGVRGGGVQVRIERLTIERGEMVLDHERVPLDLDLPRFRGHLDARRSGALEGNLAFGPGEARFGEAPPLAVGTEMDVILDGALITVESAHLTARGTDIAYNGRIRIASRPVGDFALSGLVDLGILDRHVLRTGFDLRGAGRYEGRLDVEGSRFRLAGSMEGSEGSFTGVPVPRFAGQVAWNETGLHIRDLGVTTLGGAAHLDIDVPRRPGLARVAGTVEGVDAEGLLMPLFGIGAAGVGAAATGDLSLEWPRGRVRQISGTIAADLAPLTDGRTPVSGRFEWRAEKGVQIVEKADFRTPTTWARLAGPIEADDRANLSIDAESADVAQTDDLLARLRRSLGARDAGVAGLAGSGSFRGRWRGTLQEPVFEGRFTGRDVGYLGVLWGSAEWAGTATTGTVTSRSLIVRRPGGEIWLDGRTETGNYGEEDGVEVRVRFRGWPASDFTRAFGWTFDLTGLVSGEADVAGRRSAPVGTVRLTAAAGHGYGVPFADLQVAARLRGGVSEVLSGRAQVGGGAVRFRGSLTSAGVYDASAEAQDVDVADVFPRLTPKAPWGGKASGTLTFQGALGRPRLVARLTSPRLFLGDEGVGAVEAALRGMGDGTLELSATCRSPRVDIAVAGRIGATPPYTSALRLVARDTSVDPFLRAAHENVPDAIAIVATGEGRLQGPLQSPRDLEADITLPALDVLLPELPIRSREPLRVRIAEGRLEVRDLHLAGEGTDLAVGGTATLIGDGPLALTAKGRADLGALAAISPRLRGRGAASLSLEISGTARAPRVDGRLDIEGAGLRVRGFPHGVEAVRGTVRFSEAAAQFSEVTGTVGGGAVVFDGQAAYGQGRLSSFEVQATGKGMALRYPEGLRSVVDADLRVFGDRTTQWMTGEIDVRQAAWTRRYDVASELLAAGPAVSTESTREGHIRFDVKLRVPGTFTVDNNLATLVARADLSLQGSDAAPVVLGRAEIDRGRVYFQGNTYVIRRGTIEFANPQRTDPLFDIEAETRLRSYRVTLKVNGTLGRVYPTLTSDPPLTAVQILNLLAGADETTVASLQSQADQARLAATGAATLAAGKIAEEVGLERGAERLLGLNRFSIDPSVVRGGVTNPTARLTVGKRITPDLNVLYSVDLRGTEERVLSVEYTLSDRLSVLLTNTEPGGLGFDLRLRHSR